MKGKEEREEGGRWGTEKVNGNKVVKEKVKEGDDPTAKRKIKSLCCSDKSRTLREVVFFCVSTLTIDRPMGNVG